MNEKSVNNLIHRASAVRKNAYIPYSQFSVGCAVLLSDGEIIEGVNIENASFSLTICAERSALAQVVSRGLQHMIKALAVVTRSAKLTAPCGACRQFLHELLPSQTAIVLANDDGKIATYKIEELLPCAFGRESLI